MSDYKLIDITRLTKFKDKLLGILTYSSPATNTSNTSIEFIDTVSQTNGKISATKKKVSTFAGNTAGLVPAPGTGDTGKFLGSDGKWNKPTGTTYNNYTTSTTTKAGDTGKFLKGDSGWSSLPTASTTNSGIVKLSSATDSNAENIAATPKAVSSAIKGLSCTDPSADARTSTTFISNISQTNGKVSATKKKLPTFAGSSQPGIVSASKELSENYLLNATGDWTAIDEELDPDSTNPVQNKIATLNMNGVICTTDARTKIKEVDMPGFVFYEGATIKVLFKQGCSVDYPQLKVGNTEAKKILAYRSGLPIDINGLKGSLVSRFSTVSAVWQAHTILELMYDGKNWVIMGNPVLFSNTIRNSSYEKRANGLLIQWGQTTEANNVVEIQFPLSFSSEKSYSAQALHEGISGVAHSLSNFTKSSMTLDTSDSSVKYIYHWFAIGF